MAILKVKNKKTGLWEEVPAIQGEKGESGVYLGSTEPANESTVWIDPKGIATDITGKSAYEVAVCNGFKGTEEEWLASIGPELKQELGDDRNLSMSQAAITSAVNNRLEKGLNGTVTILVDEWVDETPTRATINMGEIDDGDLIIITPANADTFRECSSKHIHIDNLELDTEKNTLVMLRCSEGLGVPTITLKFDYQILKANFPSGRAIAQLSGIDYEAVVYDALGDNPNVAISQKIVTETLSQKADKKYEDVVDTLVGGAEDEGKSARTIANEATTANITSHNAATDSHSDIRLAIQECQNQINNFLDVDEATKVKLSEVLTMIESAEESGDIEQLTILKVNISDIVNDLTTNVIDKPLSAAQGAVLKGLVDVIVGSDTGKSVRVISEEVFKSDAMKTYLLDMFHPVGSTVMNRELSWDPNVAWGGTWLRIEEKFIVGAHHLAVPGHPYEVGSVHGSDKVTLTVQNLPDHTHYIGDDNNLLIGAPGGAQPDISGNIAIGNKTGRGTTLRTNQSSQCHGNAFSILPPYTPVFIWYRVA